VSVVLLPVQHTCLLYSLPFQTWPASLIENKSGTNGTEDLAVATYRLALPLQGAFALTILLIINMYFAGMSAITATSRIGYELTIHRCCS
jgi:amino acid transporter